MEFEINTIQHNTITNAKSCQIYCHHRFVKINISQIPYLSEYSAHFYNQSGNIEKKKCNIREEEHALVKCKLIIPFQAFVRVILNCIGRVLAQQTSNLWDCLR
jgi:hypothetical protein